MTEYLSECFGSGIASSAFAFPKGTPVYMKDSYLLEQYVWQNNAFIMITPKDSSVRLPVLKKHYYQIKELVGISCALNLEWLTPRQKSALIEDKIPFVSGKNQIYLPFWGCIFQEKYKQPKTVPQKMTPTTQLVFLWIYYAAGNQQKMNLTAVSDKTGIPRSSISRAFAELAEYGLVKQVQDGTIKWIEFCGELSGVMNRAMSYLVSPVGRHIYMKEMPHNAEYRLGGLRALPAISTTERDDSIVFSKKSADSLPSDLLLPQKEFDDFGGIAAEVWKYDPHLLSSGKTVDDISLLLSLRENEDERIQKELDKIKEKYGLDV